MMRLFPQGQTQMVAGAALGYATYLVSKCPCSRLGSCHLKEIFLAVAVGAGLVLRDNGML
jgi:hypothetical protein